MATNKSEDTRKTSFDPIRTPLLAALGAGNLAGQAVADAMNKAKERVTESSEVARKNIEELPTDVEQLRERFDPAELRKLLDEYTEAALKLYQKLAESGEEAWERLLTQPQVKRSIEQLEEALQTAQERVGDFSGDARERVDEVLALVSKRTRSLGEKAATSIGETSSDVAEAIDEAGSEAAHETRSVSRKAANRTSPRTTSAARRGGSSTSSTSSTSSNTRKSTGGGSKSTK
ncbi:heparin binding hemagglutinin HbhA [Prauserella shujinwangii]|uniref:Heparin binding hemagglutinin HbhA n=1 Tax=Prauserella shujinwangii TaxID=1453103 RepID=A0A2T0LQA1_9PSEU|nr:hypothetical protein [Prauserella shujinwangii]PRX45501.1 heparin binding hemagglutinin HbhA [Prauserella shujinwangii]